MLARKRDISTCLPTFRRQQSRFRELERRARPKMEGDRREAVMGAGKHEKIALDSVPTAPVTISRGKRGRERQHPMKHLRVSQLSRYCSPQQGIHKSFTRSHKTRSTKRDRRIIHMQIANMSFDQILDLTADVCHLIFNEKTQYEPIRVNLSK